MKVKTEVLRAAVFTDEPYFTVEDYLNTEKKGANPTSIAISHYFSGT